MFISPLFEESRKRRSQRSERAAPHMENKHFREEMFPR
jgi:hypothetical protein